MSGHGGFSGIGGVGGGATKVRNGKDTIDLSDTPLKYGKNDDLNAGLRESLDKKEKEIYKRSRENLVYYDENGEHIGTDVGNGTSVVVDEKKMSKAYSVTHNHPREKGKLGGSFSVIDNDGHGDMVVFTSHSNVRNMRATAKEGTYSITKKDNFRSKEFLQHMKSVQDKYVKERQERNRKIDDAYRQSKDRDVYIKERAKSFNKYLTQMHNEYIKGQKEYGYTYTLERRRK